MTEESVATTIDRDDPLPSEEEVESPDAVDGEDTEDDIEPEDEPDAGGEA